MTPCFSPRLYNFSAVQAVGVLVVVASLVFSNPAQAETVAAGGSPAAAAGVVPVFSLQPRSQSVTSGSGLTLSVAATGTPSPDFQWSKNGINIAGATNASLSIPPLMNTTGGVYTAVASNTAGSAASAGAVVTIAAGSPPLGNVTPEITMQPASQDLREGDTTTLTIAATGTPAPSYQWRKNGSDIAGATSPTLVLSSLLNIQSGTYTAVASNIMGAATSAPATLVVSPRISLPVYLAPVFTMQPVSQMATAGGAVTLVVAAAGKTAPTFHWLKNGVPMVGASQARLTLSPLMMSDSGSYVAVATNADGWVASSAATLTVAATPAVNPPLITAQPASQTAAVGVEVTFTVAASGFPTPNFQWRKNGSNIAGATNANYAVSAVNSLNGASYTVMVKNKAGSVLSSPAVLTVRKPPQITGQPESQTVREGQSVTFVVNPASYQWFKDGVAIPGATNGAYQIGTVLGIDAGQYTVVVTSEGGVATSSPAQLTVSNAPPVPTR